MGNHDAGRAMVRTALALDGQSEKTGQAALEILDIACPPCRGCDAEFDDEPGPDRQFGQLLGRAFLEGLECDSEADEDGALWYENVIERFSQRYEFW